MQVLHFIFKIIFRDKDSFKIRSNVQKHVVVSLCQVSDNNKLKVTKNYVKKIKRKGLGLSAPRALYGIAPLFSLKLLIIKLFFS